MGTRCAVFVKPDKKSSTDDIICSFSVNYDGYLSGVGADIYRFIESGKMVNGIGMDSDKVQFNGMGCFAAALISHLKTRPGNVYMISSSHFEEAEDYEYTYLVYPVGKKIKLFFLKNNKWVAYEKSTQNKLGYSVKYADIYSSISEILFTYPVQARYAKSKLKSVGVTFYGGDKSDKRYLVITPYKDYLRVTEGYKYRKSDGIAFLYKDYKSVDSLIDSLVDKVINPYEKSFKTIRK